MFIKVNSTGKTQLIFNWFLQLGIIFSLALLIVSLILHIFIHFSIPIFCIFYLLYVIMSFYSATFSYLVNTQKADSIHTLMEKLYYTPPTLTFKAISYHYETRDNTHTDSNGNIIRTTSTEKVITHTEEENFRYYSWRDISGCFLLDTDKLIKNSKKIYIKLELDFNLNFADDITKYDYELQKLNFKQRNIHRDVHLDFSENIKLSGYNQYNLIKITKDNPILLNLGFYLIFTFIFPFIEFFKIYVNSFCIDQKYTIKKIVSTRYDLNDSEILKKYEDSLPKIFIYGDKVSYDKSTERNNKIYDLPTGEELEESSKYSMTNYENNYGKIFTFNLAPFSTTKGTADWVLY